MEINDYPEEVSVILTAIYESLTADGFFIEHDIVNQGKRSLIDAAGPILMKRWVAGDLNPSDIPENDLKDILTRTITYAVIYELKEKKLVDTIEDETGEEIIFLTDAGREARKKQYP